MSRLHTVDEDAEPLSTSPGTRRRVTESGALGFGQVPPRRQREGQIKFFTIADVADHLQVSGRTVRRWIAAGDLVVHRVGAIVRIAESDFRSFLALRREAQ
jgi:excisionase family DNA binding protein